MLGLAAAVVAVTYFTVPADALPAMLGRLRGVTTHRADRGRVAAVVSIVVLVGAVATLMATQFRTQFRHRVSSTWRRLIGN